MSSWRLSGGIGAPEEERPVMTQGLGFPLRPVDGVPNPEDEDLLVGVPIAKTQFMQWAGAYSAGLLYPEGSVVVDEGWQMIASRATLDKAAPVSAGSPAWTMADTPAWSTEQTSAVVYSGVYIEVAVGGWINGLRVSVPELSGSTNYRIVIIDVTDPNLPIYSTIEEPVLDLVTWTVISTFEKIVVAGDKFFVYLDSLNTGGSTPVTGGWSYAGSSNNASPPAQGWNHHSQQNLLRIDKTDLDGTDRSSELAGMIPGTNIQFAETVEASRSYTYFTTGAATDEGTFFSYPVNLSSTGAGGAPREGVTTMIADVPVAQSTQYVELPGGAPAVTWGTVTGFLQYDGVDQGGDANGYGVDIYFDEATISPDWEFMAFTGT